MLQEVGKLKATRWNWDRAQAYKHRSAGIYLKTLQVVPLPGHPSGGRKARCGNIPGTAKGTAGVFGSDYKRRKVPTAQEHETKQQTMCLEALVP